jgi:glycosyltransferase involved in cell wall biosynthesis
MSKVDVVVPCYNYARYLDYCVSSILSQRDVDVRVLIIDDCSPDNTPEIAQRLCADDARVNYVRNAQNRRLIGVSNQGVMEWARAPYTLLISADDALVPGALARAVHVLDRHPEVGFVYGPALIMGPDNEQPVEISDGPADYRVLSGEEFLKFSILSGNPVPTPGIVTRTATQHIVGGYNPDYPYASDVDVWMRFALAGPVAAMRNVQGFYRVHNSNMHFSSWTGGLGDRPAIVRLWENLINECADSEKAARLRRWADRAKAEFAASAFWGAGEAYAKRDDEALKLFRDFAIELDSSYRSRNFTLRQRIERLIGFNPISSLRGYRRKPTQHTRRAMIPGHQFGEVPIGESASD